MDQIDRQILMQLQHNAAQPVADIARKVVVGNALLATDPANEEISHSQTRCPA